MDRLRQKIRQLMALRRQRRQLLTMDERMRNDLALSRVDAEQLAGRYGKVRHPAVERRDRPCSR